MTDSAAPRIALVTDSDLNRHLLQNVLSDGGYLLAQSMDFSALDGFLAKDEAAVFDAWLLDVEGSNIQPSLEKLLEQSDLPLLLNDNIPLTTDIAATDLWRRRLLEKLEVVALRNDDSSLSTTAELQSPDLPAQIWVLAASLGGPEAVKLFLSALPAGLPVALVYGQHIETNFDTVLAKGIGTQHCYPLQLVRGEQMLAQGSVAVVPADRQLRFLPRGRVIETRKAWAGSYQPALDQVIADLARIYRDKLGVIIFSGTCNDGEIGCRVAKACGATIWAQEPESCVSAAMPNAAIDTGCVSFQGTPEQLAAELVKKISTDSNANIALPA
ncbi:chemotaxis protein CheB [Oceanicoccus sp. KOV_DT_Chl]|uniref:chemotaxis protein CheB n=1 Tax=Oceanicoccus sp. KOV_DT_Chl TaxID=1904639 RepID=UPI000C7CFA9C|nr:chemotaxis protein CheB [Oceanicoccus sp. KOV_DT_Chl]